MSYAETYVRWLVTGVNLPSVTSAINNCWNGLSFLPRNATLFESSSQRTLEMTGILELALSVATTGQLVCYPILSERKPKRLLD